GQARLNNLNDHTDALRPFARHTTYFDWAMSEWGSHLSRYLWDRSAGPYGVDMLDENDKAATVFWYVPVLPVNPGNVLPKSDVWLSRGLYYYRSGWPAGGSSDDIVFSFYSGEFRGGHAQEDQNQITLAAFGEKLLLDHGAGSAAKQSEAHNIVRVDQLGQHNAGSSVGTDGRIVKSMITGFADYMCGDATGAYTTYSSYNAPDVPLPGTDWSWGYDGGNPVQQALRRVVVVHGPGFPTYMIVQDDIQKDGTVHRYDWCAHLPENASVAFGTALEPVRATAGNARLDVHALFPPKATLAGIQLLSFDNENEDPDSKMLQLTSFAVNPKFTVLLMPTRTSDPAPVVYTTTFAAGTLSTVVSAAGTADVVFVRRPALTPVAQTPDAALPEIDGCGSLAINAELAVVRMSNGVVSRYLAVNAKSISCSSGDVVVIYDGSATVAFDGSLVHIDRADVQFRILGDGVTNVVCNGVAVPTELAGRYLVNATTNVSDHPVPDGVGALRAYPNPFNPSVQIAFTTQSVSRVEARIYDPAGRLVTTLESGMLPAGEHTMAWNGNDADGRPVASGVYFLRIRSASKESSLKLVLLR
ncbi:MAG TPA: FlgD immunoglobulin-like domain containing protein, partial [Candidatus Krumholzibacteria bacterium]|nr:FlgD immunoglobulin-like domain containing protein [Candidatus Krumholzibacteria bacterium]